MPEDGDGRALPAAAAMGAAGAEERERTLAATQRRLVALHRKSTRQVSRLLDGLGDGAPPAARRGLSKALLDHNVGLASEIRQFAKARAENGRPLADAQAGALSGLEMLRVTFAGAGLPPAGAPLLAEAEPPGDA